MSDPTPLPSNPTPQASHPRPPQPETSTRDNPHRPSQPMSVPADQTPGTGPSWQSHTGTFGPETSVAEQCPNPDVGIPDAEQSPTTGKTFERPSALTGLARSWTAVVGLVIIFGRDFVEGGFDTFREMSGFTLVVLGIVAVVAVLTLVYGIVEWRTTRFVADAEEFRVEHNFISKDSRRISYAKIQSVELERRVVARLLGLAAVNIDVGAEDSTKLEFLSVARAEALRDQLLRKMRSLQVHAAQDSAQTDASPGPDGTPAATLEGPRTGRLLLQVRTTTLIRGTVASVGFIIWVLLMSLMVIPAVIEGGPAAIIAPLIAVIGYLATEIVNNLRFRIERVPDGLRITRGLLSTTSRSLKADRIQAVQISQDLLQRVSGLYRMRVTVLGGGLLGGDAATNSLVLPYGSWADVRTVLGAFWPGIAVDNIPRSGQPSRARWLTPLAFHNHQWGVDEETIIAQTGWLHTEMVLVPHRRMQSIGASQGPIQRLLRLATLMVHTTTGPVSMVIKHLDVADARRFLDDQVIRARIARNTPGEPGYLRHLSAPEPVNEEPVPTHPDDAAEVVPTQPDDDAEAVPTQPDDDAEAVPTQPDDDADTASAKR